MFLELTTFNVPRQLWAHISVMFEFPATGGVIATPQVKSNTIIVNLDNVAFCILETSIMNATISKVNDVKIVLP